MQHIVPDHNRSMFLTESRLAFAHRCVQLNSACDANNVEVAPSMSSNPPVRGTMVTKALDHEPDFSGQTLDRYTLLRRLGMGGMGAVYDAEHTRLRKRVAVKILRNEFARNEVHRKRFLREARAASSVIHPHVVAISDFGETLDGHVFFVMELLEGNDLSDLLEAKQKLEAGSVRRILLQVTSALETAHHQGVIHRDIKPSNVFLTNVLGQKDKDLVKVLDFGIAKLSNDAGGITSKLTSTDEIFGTVGYMAPEMAKGVTDDHRSDIYAVGIMMYRMLTGVLPFHQGNAFQILSQHISSPVPPPRDKDPSISAGMAAIITKALRKDPQDRFQSMREFGEALELSELPTVGAGTLILSNWSPPRRTGTTETLSAPQEVEITRAWPARPSDHDSPPSSTVSRVKPNAVGHDITHAAKTECARRPSTSSNTVVSDTTTLSPTDRTPPLNQRAFDQHSPDESMAELHSTTSSLWSRTRLMASLILLSAATFAGTAALGSYFAQQSRDSTETLLHDRDRADDGGPSRGERADQSTPND